MGLVTTVSISEDVQTEIEDDEIMDYIGESPELLAKLGIYGDDTARWADAFALFDTVSKLQAIEALKHAVPGIKIELP